MLALLSPAKKLDLDTPPTTGIHTQPKLLDHAEQLMGITRGLSTGDLRDLMGISDALAELNQERFQQMHTPFTPDNARPAAQTFAGEVYTALDAWSLDEDALAWSQDHVAILSGLYGLLRPLDLMQPYRLEMGTKLENPRGANLYSFWKPTLTEAVAEAVEGHDDPTIINLASTEYSKAVDLKKLGVPVITPKFQDVKNGKARTLFLFAKRARGWMVRWMVEQRATDPEQLKAFDVGGYRYDDDASDDRTWVFRRPQPPPPK
jgi:cytoplasmic iron level regulating protein YaaA (DUF328/UPF0246 family)